MTRSLRDCPAEPMLLIGVQLLATQQRSQLAVLAGIGLLEDRSLVLDREDAAGALSQLGVRHDFRLNSGNGFWHCALLNALIYISHNQLAQA